MMSADIYLGRLVLNAIDTIKSRKNRPSLDRICRYLERVHSVEKATSIRVLEGLIDSGKVKEVVFNGFISYRNADRMRYPNYNQITRKFVLNTVPMVNGSFVNESDDNKSDYLNVDESQDDSLSLDPDKLEFFLQSQPLDPLDAASEEASKKKRSVKEQKQSDDSKGKSAHSKVNNKMDSIKIEKEIQKSKKEEQTCTRKGERFSRKPIKYDPSEYVFPSLKRKPKEPFVFEPTIKKKKKVKQKVKSSSELTKEFEHWIKKQHCKNLEQQESETAVCCICLGQKDSNRMITCRSCLSKGHLLCVRREGTSIGWLCPECKTPENSICIVCDVKDSNNGVVISCDLCGESFHKGCHNPTIEDDVQPGRGKWRCSRCPGSSIPAYMDVRKIGKNATVVSNPDEKEDEKELEVEIKKIELAKREASEVVKVELVEVVKDTSADTSLEDVPDDKESKDDELEVEVINIEDSEKRREEETSKDESFESELTNNNEMKDNESDEDKVLLLNFSPPGSSETDERDKDPEPPPLIEDKVRNSSFISRDGSNFEVQLIPRIVKTESLAFFPPLPPPPPPASIHNSCSSSSSSSYSSGDSQGESEQVSLTLAEEEIKKEDDKPIEESQQAAKDASEVSQEQTQQVVSLSPQKIPFVRLERNSKTELALGSLLKNRSIQMNVGSSRKPENIVSPKPAVIPRPMTSLIPRLGVELANSARDPYEGHAMDLSIPDATRWTKEDVYEYFIKYFKVEVAESFREQEVDGQALLLMSRGDIIRGLGLKLGVALKVLYHVKKLQIRRSDIKLLWAI